jgi:zinc D-Ala-D-Ala carboxypeptidase
MKMLTENFSYDELSCKCCNACDMDPGFLEKLQKLRDAYGRSMVITSGFRCQKHNADVGGMKTSQHLFGKAVDVKCAVGAERHNLVKLAFQLGFTGIGVAKGFVHLDVRDGSKSLWMY